MGSELRVPAWLTEETRPSSTSEVVRVRRFRDRLLRPFVSETRVGSTVIVGGRPGGGKADGLRQSETREALLLSRDVLLLKCGASERVRSMALAAIDRALVLNPLPVRPAERRRVGRGLDPHAGCNPTLSERRLAERE